ncbi:glycosyl hydrolase [Fibrobacter sp. UWR1]|uniref:glycosyl hydrolase n=1 Tax=Fibrobacter sp. UWR1 TaxID=2135645 RepID=UPI000DAE1D06|nr:glycosyl hydrolase [Fibrobacter sp. UWR1]PZW72278.1 carbohydrate-binding protein with CBM35 doain [Fibrobacter sp. UWR1]
MSWKKNLAVFGLAMAATTFAAQYEAESAELTDDAAAAANASASGGKYVKLNGGNINFTVSVETAGSYTIVVHYMNNYDGDKINYVAANGASSQVSFPVTAKGEFVDVETVLKLNAGENKVSIENSWGWIDVDYISVEPFKAKEFTLCNAPVTADATPSAKKLYNFLVNNFGKKTISGVMTGNMDAYTVGDMTQHEDVQAVFKAGGKFPALVGVDMMNATGGNSESSWFQTYTEKAMDVVKSTWKKGGIPAITWHWRPGEEEEFYTANGNKTKNTDFDFTNAFVKGTTSWDTLSTEYKVLAGDIDKVSKLFLELQEEGVAAIFRPLHESGGNWFWWSTHTGKQFAALYQLLYERMVFKNGVNNLIWDFNPQDASKITWTPGENYYDVISVDIYNKANDHQSNASAFIDFTNKAGTNKVISLSENGPIPDVKGIYDDNAPWSWWMPWYESWSGGYVSQTANSVWQSNFADERIITLDKMPGWDSYNEANAGTKTCPTSKASASFGADTSKANQEYVDLIMGVTFKALNDSGANIELQKVPNLTGAKTIAVDIANLGEGGADGGIWVGLAFVRNGMEDDGWTWEMSKSDGCWIKDGAKSTCEFDITTYEDDNGVEHPMDLDNLFSVTLMVGGAVGFNGMVTFDNMVADNGKVISAFDDKKGLFTAATQSKGHITKIELLNKDGTPTAIKAIAAAKATSLHVQGKSVMFTAASAGNVSVDVFGMNGKRVATLYRGTLAAGTHAFDMSELSKGQFIIRVKGAGMDAAQVVKIK